MKLQGTIVWLTGRPASGKTTLAKTVARTLSELGPVEILDGDELREWLSKGLGYSRADRKDNCQRVGRLARMLARHNVMVLVALVSPFAVDRQEQKQLATKDGLRFFEVFVQAADEVLKKRDPKGHYKRAMNGDLNDFTGISSPYEIPAKPDLLIATDEEPIADSANKIHRLVTNR